MDKLALNGGKPIIKNPLPSHMLGTALIGEEELNELKDVVYEKSPFRHYGVGNPTKVAKLEAQMRGFFGCKYALAVSSGTAALSCAIAALGIGPGDEVIMPGFSWYSDYNAIVNMGAIPVFADVDELLNIDPADFEKKITTRTKAVIVVYFQGSAAQMDKIMRIAKDHNIKVIEDCAQALGGEYKGVKLGTLGDIAIFSFQVNKMLTSGEGGALITNNENYFIRAVRYHDLGFVRPAFAEQLEDKTLADTELSFVGMQFRMNELQGAFLLAQFRKLNTILTTCRHHHKRIRNYFQNNTHFSIRYIEGDCGITIFMLFKEAENAKYFGECLEAEGVPMGPTSACSNLTSMYPIISRKLAHAALPPFGNGYAGENNEYSPEKSCPNTDLIVRRMVAFGIGPLYTNDNVTDIIQAIEKVDTALY